MDKKTLSPSEELLKLFGYDEVLNDKKIDEIHDKILTLLDQGANIDAADSYDDTILIKATRFGAGKIVKMLVERDANIYHQNLVGDTAIANSIIFGDLDQIKLLVDSLQKDYRSENHEKRRQSDSAYSDAIASAVDSNNPKIVEIFCSFENEEKSKLARNEAFIYAVGLDKDEIVKQLLDDVSLKTIKDALNTSSCSNNDNIFGLIWGFAKENYPDLKKDFLASFADNSQINPKIYEALIKDSVVEKADLLKLSQSLEKRLKSSDDDLLKSISKKYYELIFKQKNLLTEAGLSHLASDEDLSKKKKDFESKLADDVDFLCPISQAIIANPVSINSSVQIYEKDVIKHWIELKKSDPITREELNPKEINKFLKDRTEDYQSKISQFANEVFDKYKNFAESAKEKKSDTETLLNGREIDANLVKYLDKNQANYIDEIKRNFDQKFADKVRELLPPNPSISSQKASRLLNQQQKLPSSRSAIS